MTGFTEVAQDVYVLRYPALDVNTTLVVGDGAALLVDTLSTDAQAGELAEAVRRVTPHPLRTVVNTHHHFDHCFGNAVLTAGGGVAVWGHEEAAALLSERPRALQREWYEDWVDSQPELAAGLAAVRVVPPDRTVHQQATLDVGGRSVILRHLGRGHTAGDLVVQVPGADLVVAGDLVEQGGPPAFEDSYPVEWPDTVHALLHLVGPGTAVVPGHGAVVDRGFVSGQHEELAALAWLIREGHANGAPAEAIAGKALFGGHGAASEPSGARRAVMRPHPGDNAAVTAVRRGYAELSGRSG